MTAQTVDSKNNSHCPGHSRWPRGQEWSGQWAEPDTGTYSVNNQETGTTIITDCFYIALFSSLEQTHCSQVTFDSE